MMSESESATESKDPDILNSIVLGRGILPRKPGQNSLTHDCSLQQLSVLRLRRFIRERMNHLRSG